MKIDERYLTKADPQLRNALKEAKGSEVLRAIMLLGSDEEGHDLDQDLHPSEFPSRRAWREALIARRQRELELEIRDTLQALKNLDLKARGGKTSRTVVVEGPARQILTSLELPGVRHASLDRSIELQALAH